MQYVLGTGIFELDDLILNTFGCFTGAESGLLINEHLNRSVSCHRVPDTAEKKV